MNDHPSLCFPPHRPPRLAARSSPLARCMAAAGLLALLTACGGSGNDDAPPPDEPATAAPTPVGEPLGIADRATIGPAGGTLESSDGRLRIDIPAGALASEQEVMIQPITNLAHGASGPAYRLGPEGEFAVPVRLTFYFSPEDVRGTAAGMLRIASQDDAGFWELHEDATLDADEGTIRIDTRHFSDWSLVSGALLFPASATLKPGDTLPLSVVTCDRVSRGDLLAPLLAECRPSQVIGNLTRNWAVNGAAGGNAQVGTITLEENRTARYTAPAVAPQPPTVAVSTQYTGLQGELVLLVADILVQSGICTPESVGLPCRFELLEFNRKTLPYDDLPREDWENPESVVAGRLSLQDSDGDGTGTWSLRIHWVEQRMAGPLEQFEQLAGDYTSGSDGNLQFTVPGGATFTGQIAQGTVSITGYPFSSQNANVQARLRFRQP